MTQYDPGYGTVGGEPTEEFSVASHRAPASRWPWVAAGILVLIISIMCGVTVQNWPSGVNPIPSSSRTTPNPTPAPVVTTARMSPPEQAAGVEVRSVTPGAFCKKEDVGTAGYNKGVKYVCRYDGSEVPRWKRS